MKVFLTTLLLSASANAIEPTPADMNQPATWKAGVLSYATRILPFKDWEKRPEAAILKLFPAYKEPMRDKSENGMIMRRPDPQTIFVARSTFVIEKPVDSINIRSLTSLAAIQQIDTSFAHQQVSANQLFKAKDGKPHNTPTDGSRQWCAAPDALCLQSTWQYPTSIKGAVALYSAGSGDKKDLFQQTQSEIVVVPQAQLGKLAVINHGASPVAAMEQSIFYVNQIMRWGKNIVMIEAGANNTTHVTVFSVVSIASNYYDKTVMGLNVGTFLTGGLATECGAGLLAGASRLSACAATRMMEILKN